MTKQNERRIYSAKISVLGSDGIRPQISGWFHLPLLSGDYGLKHAAWMGKMVNNNICGKERKPKRKALARFLNLSAGLPAFDFCRPFP
ncbi:MAG: hypothetical protein RMK89_12530 [Armatimonadota bacterium]|nr:hypothetical protein [Armatimonadota bacterium]MDW8144275.1 hypothetical protein [Armatimonadota bacterium]